MEKDISIYYSLAPLLSQRCIFNYSVGPRGCGKSFDGKRLGISRFIKKGKEFIYLRRYKSELEKITDFFSDIRFKFPNHKLEQVGNKLYINDKLAGYMFALTETPHLKSVPFPNVDTIIFDEFIIDKGRVTYLKGEAELLLEFYDTVDRSRDTTVLIAIGNAITQVTPHFIYWNMYPSLNQRFVKDMKKSVCIEMYINNNFLEKKLDTRYGRAIKGTRYGQYNLLNNFLRDSDSYIAKRPPTANNKLYQFILDGQKYSLWRDTRNQVFYIDETYEANFGYYRTYVLNPNEMDEKDKSHILLKKNNAIMKRVKEWITVGDVYFNNQTSKQKFFDILLT